MTPEPVTTERCKACGKEHDFLHAEDCMYVAVKRLNETLSRLCALLDRAQETKP